MSKLMKNSDEMKAQQADGLRKYTDKTPDEIDELISAVLSICSHLTPMESFLILESSIEGVKRRVLKENESAKNKIKGVILDEKNKNKGNDVEGSEKAKGDDLREHRS